MTTAVSMLRRRVPDQENGTLQVQEIKTMNMHKGMAMAELLKLLFQAITAFCSFYLLIVFLYPNSERLNAIMKNSVAITDDAVFLSKDARKKYTQFVIPINEFSELVGGNTTLTLIRDMQRLVDDFQRETSTVNVTLLVEKFTKVVDKFEHLVDEFSTAKQVTVNIPFPNSEN
jgi:hypothetical protein